MISLRHTPSLTANHVWHLDPLRWDLFTFEVRFLNQNEPTKTSEVSLCSTFFTADLVLSSPSLCSLDSSSP